MLDESDLKYQLIADNLAKEIMQCGIDYFNKIISKVALDYNELDFAYNSNNYVNVFLNLKLLYYKYTEFWWLLQTLFSLLQKYARISVFFI